MNTLQSILQSITTLLDRSRVTPIRAVLFGNVLSVFLLIVLSNIGVLPLRLWDFVFFSVLFFLIALYRSGFVFALLIGMLPLETVNLAPIEWGFNIRPYQFLAILLIPALLIRLATKRIRRPLFVMTVRDGILLAFLLTPCLMIPFLPFPEFISVALKQAIILLSFGALYFLGRSFLKKESDIRIALSFFLSSIFVVLCYAFWQRLRFAWHLPSFEVMDGRPNGTFPEADFLGGVIAVILSGMIPFGLNFFFSETVSVVKKTIFALFLFLLSLMLILTVARSGWIATAAGMIVGGGIFFVRHGLVRALRTWDTPVLRSMAFGKFFIGIPLLLALVTVIVFHLTPFDIIDRGESVSSGLQKITVSCLSPDTVLPRILHTADELASNGCRHILLEEIAEEELAGHSVQEVYRPDPNITIRKHIYAQSLGLIREYPLTGIGFGNVSHFLGIDGNGRGLNASNVFLEVWIGAGLLGFTAFFIFWFSFPIVLLKHIERVIQPGDSVVAISLFASWAALTVFNGFNSGLLLGTLWIFFAILVWAVTSFDSKPSS